MLRLLVLMQFFIKMSVSFRNNSSDIIHYTVRKQYGSREVSFSGSVITANDSVLTIRVFNQSVPNHKLTNNLFNVTFDCSEIEVRSCNVTEIEQNFLKNQNVTNVLSITNSQIATIKQETFVALNIKCLMLDFNGIRVIEERAFVDLSNLEILDLSDNLLTHLNSASFSSVP